MTRATRVAVVAAALALLASACTDAQRSADPTPDGAGPVELEREWTITSYATIPQSWNERYWFSDYSYAGFDAGGMTTTSTGLKMFDAQTGKKIKLGLGGHDCGVPPVQPGDTFAPILISKEAPDHYYSKQEWRMGLPGDRRTCTGLAVFDLTTGKKAWQLPVGSTPPLTDSRGIDAVMVRWGKDGVRCFHPASGKRLSSNLDERCVSGDGYVPELYDHYGSQLKRDPEAVEVARVGGVIVLRVPRLNQSDIFRAHDLKTGLTLWVDEITPDEPTSVVGYGMTPEALVRITATYAEQDLPPEPLTVPLTSTIIRVDPRSGEELEVLGQVSEGVFKAQVGDISIFHVDIDQGMGAHLAGFRIPLA
jgi:hypothetical protein